MFAHTGSPLEAVDILPIKNTDMNLAVLQNGMMHPTLDQSIESYNGYFILDDQPLPRLQFKARCPAPLIDNNALLGSTESMLQEWDRYFAR